MERAPADLRPPGHASQARAALGVTGHGTGSGARPRPWGCTVISSFGGVLGILDAPLGRRPPTRHLVGTGDVDAGVRPALDAQPDAHAGRVLAGVGQGLLDDPIDGAGEHLVGLGCAVEIDRGAQRLLGGEHPVDDFLEVLQTRGGLGRAHRLAQDGQQGAQVPHGPLSLLPYALSGGPGIVLVRGVPRIRGAPRVRRREHTSLQGCGVKGEQRQTVTESVVHLAGHPLTLGLQADGVRQSG